MVPVLAEDFIIDRIERMLAERGLSRYELSKRSGVPQSSLSTLLNQKNTPTFHTLNKICDGLGITMAQFFSVDEHIDLTDDQEKLLKKWDIMDDREKEIVMAFIEGVTIKK